MASTATDENKILTRYDHPRPGHIFISTAGLWTGTPIFNPTHHPLSVIKRVTMNLSVPAAALY